MGSAEVTERLRRGRELLREQPVLAAVEARAALAVSRADADAWRLLGAALRLSGEDEDAAQAELAAISASVHDPALIAAAEALLDNDLAMAETVLRPRLHANPFDVAAIRMMAELAGRLGRYPDAEKLLRRALELAPAFGPARANLATVLYRQNRPAEAIAELDRLQDGDEANAGHQNLKAAALGRLGSYQEAILVYEQVLARLPDQPKVWMSYGHALKTVGRQPDAIAAYRRALALAPTLGEVWWSLANLKTMTFADADVAAMAAALAGPDLRLEDRFHLHFALGRAHEERGGFEASFAHYAEGNRLRGETIGYRADETSALVERSKTMFSPAFFTERAGLGCPAPDPIFILGMPRAGSTLIEQILASHSQVEGTMELPDIPAMARRLGGGKVGREGGAYPACLAELDGEALSALGEEYLERTRIQRKTDRPYFIDKMPNNWAHAGLIRLILPNAKIVDARRHPLDCCFSNFKQHYARGQGFSYSLRDMGRYYADYVALMAHLAGAMPDPAYRLIHERLIEDPEGEISALLDHLGLPFEPDCLRFHENTRAVRTASSEQVRRPINREGVDQWKPYEPWLAPLKAALGAALDDWR
ncbi:MAG TPA: sulfotransferase [Allosphingosinicella sp.]|nr:sulfotransferase [Allosphingosinicella sp.]